MASRRINCRVWGRVALGLAAGLPAPLAAQRVLDLPVREGAGADALAGGPFAVFWNPGSASIPGARGEILLLDVRGPSSTGIDGVALAALYRLDERTALGAGLRHVGIDEIPTTSSSPLPDDVEGSLDVAETTLSVVAVREVGDGLAFGAGAHFTRASRALGAEDEVEVGAGLRRGARGWTPGIGAAVRFGERGTDWVAGIELAPAVRGPAGAAAALSYGASGSPAYRGITHRIGLSGTWGGRLRVTAGVAGEPDVGGRAWDPFIGAVVNVQRYSVGILREELPNGIGAVHTFRLGLSF